MPRRDIRMYLDDVVRACDHVLSHVEDVDEQHFLASRFVQAAVERELSIIGEAVVQIRKHDQGVAIRITAVDRIAHFRNILAHAYDIIDHSRMWKTVREDVPVLRREAAALLLELGG